MNGAYCALTSTSGITTPESSRAARRCPPAVSRSLRPLPRTARAELGRPARMLHAASTFGSRAMQRRARGTVILPFDAALRGDTGRPHRPYGPRQAARAVAQRLAHRAIAQSRSAATCELRGRLLGVAVVVLSTIVGTAIFSTLESSPSTAVKIVAGLASVGAGVLAALQTFLGFEERAAKHREVATAYGTLRREPETGMAFPEEARSSRSCWTASALAWDAIDAKAAPSRREIGEMDASTGAGWPGRHAANAACCSASSACTSRSRRLPRRWPRASLSTSTSTSGMPSTELPLRRPRIRAVATALLPGRPRLRRGGASLDDAIEAMAGLTRRASTKRSC